MQPTGSEFPWLLAILGIVLFSFAYYIAKKDIAKKKINDPENITLLYFLKSINLIWLDVILLFFLLEINAHEAFNVPPALSYLIFISLIIIQMVFHEASYRGQRRDAIATIKSSHEIKNKMLENSENELKSHIIDKNLAYLEKFAEQYKIEGMNKVINSIKEYKKNPETKEKINLRNNIIKVIITLGGHRDKRHFNYAIYALKNILDYIEK